MKHRVTIFLLSFLIFPVLSSAYSQEKAGESKQADKKAADASSKDELKKEYDLVFTKAGETELKLDLVRPAGEGDPLPVVVIIHGGGWRGGNKESNRRFLDMFAKLGFVAVSPQYRLVPKATFPAQIHDVKAAIRWLKQNAKQNRIDPDRIGAIGFSAGGHLALMLGVTDSSDGLEGDLPPQGPNTKIRAVVNYFGPTDLDGDDIPAVSKPLVEAFLGGSLDSKKSEAAKASPLDYVKEGDAPILTFQGTKDPLVPHTQAFKLVEKMTAENVQGRASFFIGDGHGWEGIENTLEEAALFLQQHLRKPESRRSR